MINPQQLILNILRAFINNLSNITIQHSLDCEKINQLVEINSISGIVGYILNKAHNIDCPDKIKQFYTEAYFSTIAITTIRDEAMKLVIDLLSKNCIDHLLFKGYVVKDLYTVPELRTFGDIDFAIRIEDRAKCNEMMRQNGFRLLEDWEPVYSYEYKLEHYEVHTELLDSNLNERVDYKAYFSDYWNHAQKIDKHTYVLEPGYHLIYLIVHIAKHLYGSGAGIRMYLDIAFYLRAYRDQIDWYQFQQEVHNLRIDRFVNTVFTAVERWFEIRSPIPLKAVDDSFMDKFLTFTLNGGVFGHNSRAARFSEVRKNSKGGSVKRADTLLKRAFPSADTIKSRYKYLDGKPWLLPAAWVHRFFKKKGTTVDYLEESKEILNTNKKDIIELNDFYQKIGI